VVGRDPAGYGVSSLVRKTALRPEGSSPLTMGAGGFSPGPAVERECPSRVWGVVSAGGKTALRPEGTSASPPPHMSTPPPFHPITFR
jgi:hypothetical protein